MPEETDEIDSSNASWADKDWEELVEIPGMVVLAIGSATLAFWEGKEPPDLGFTFFSDNGDFADFGGFWDFGDEGVTGDSSIPDFCCADISVCISAALVWTVEIWEAAGIGDSASAFNSDGLGGVPAGLWSDDTVESFK